MASIRAEIDRRNRSKVRRLNNWIANRGKWPYRAWVVLVIAPIVFPVLALSLLLKVPSAIRAAWDDWTYGCRHDFDTAQTIITAIKIGTQAPFDGTRFPR